MRKHTKQLLFVLLTLMLLAGLALFAFAEEPVIMNSGVWFDNISWTVDSNGKLTISGEGEIYDGVSALPDWKTEEHGVDIKSVEIKEGVTNIPWDAFCYFDKLISVSIPNSVTTIGAGAFYGCTSLSSISVGNNIQKIGQDAFSNTAFYNDSSNWENGVLYLGDYLIKASSLTGTYRIKNGTKLIVGDAFNECNTLTGIIMPDSIISIGEEAFCDTALTSITIPNGVKSIGSGAFRNCASLVSMTIPDSVMSIGSYAFSNCDSIASVMLPSGILSIDDGLFYGCNSLTNVIIPDGVTSIGNEAFCDCSRLTSIAIPDNVMSVGECAFLDCSSLTSVTIPDSVTGIIASAFSETALYDNEDNWSDDVFYIGNHLIQAKPSISSEYTIKEGTKSIARGAFSDCSSLTSVIIPDGVTSIGWSAFRGCSSLLRVTIPDSVTSIENDAFSETALYANETNWSDGVLYIGNHLIQAKRSISGIYTIREGTKCIANYAFSYCEDLLGVTIPDSVTILGEGAFEGCEGLTDVVIPNSVTKIDDAFGLCIRLANVTIPDSVTSMDGTFYDCFSLKSVTIPNSVTSITGTFQYCRSLTSIVIPDSVTSIGCFSFYGCNNLTNITISNSLTKVDDYAFDRCFNLGDIYYTGSEAEWNAIEINEIGNVPLLNAVIHFNYNPDEPHTHTPTTYTQPSTCTVPGYIITTCSECNDQLDYQTLPLADHQYGEWVTIKEPTITETGLRERTCTVCGVAKEQEELPMLEPFTAKDEDSGITVSYGENTYTDDQVQLHVEEDFTGSQYLTKSYTRFDAWNIKTYVNGEEAQPNVPVTVRIPLPAGYDPNNIAVFHVNSKTGEVEKINDVRVENGYIIFTATSFSVYIIVDESSVVQPDPNMCHWCGKVHEGFFQNIIAFFHRIFARLFGAKY